MSQEKTIPKKYQGKLESNYYCRAWNEKRSKYCGQIAGAGTDHKGSGRCKHHGGNSQATTITHGRYAFKSKTVQQRLEQQKQNDKNPTDIHEDIQLARAQLVDFIDRYEEITEAVLEWHASFGQEYVKAREAWIVEINEALAPEISRFDALVTNMVDSLYTELEALPKSLEKTVNSIRRRLGEFNTDARMKKYELPEPPRPSEFENKPRQMLDMGESIAHLDRITRMAERAEKMKHDQIAIEQLKIMTQHMEAITYDHLKGKLEPQEAQELLKTIKTAWFSDIRLDERTGTVMRIDRGLNA